jgi:hypothetical protein
VTNAFFAGRNGAQARAIRKARKAGNMLACNHGQLYQNGLGVRNDIACENLRKPA